MGFEDYWLKNYAISWAKHSYCSVLKIMLKNSYEQGKIECGGKWYRCLRCKEIYCCINKYSRCNTISCEGEDYEVVR